MNHRINHILNQMAALEAELRTAVHDQESRAITGPLIYGMVIPLLMLDVCVSFYQWACFPIYGYMAEILARTEQYFCPIKHAHKILGTHSKAGRVPDGVG